LLAQDLPAEDVPVDGAAWKRYAALAPYRQARQALTIKTGFFSPGATKDYFGRCQPSRARAAEQGAARHGRFELPTDRGV
jgi:hypothetical protein